MKYIILLLLIPVLFACEEGEELFYETDVCKIGNHQSWQVQPNEKGIYEFKFGLNSFTNLKRFYMDSCSVDKVTVDLAGSTFSNFILKEIEDEEGEITAEYVEMPITGISCNNNGNISGNVKKVLITVPVSPGEGDLPSGYTFFRFILDNESSSDTLDLNTKFY